VKRRYPLEALSKIRAHETTQRAREKADLALERHRAEQTLADATRNKEAEKNRLRAEGAIETTRLGSGRARAADLARAERFRQGAERRIGEREGVETRAARGSAEVKAKEARAAAALAAAHAAEKVVHEHRARFRANERRSLDNREDDAAEDAMRARQGRRGQKAR